MSNVINSHKPAEVVTFVPADSPEMVDRLSQLEFDPKDQLAHNYELINWDAFSAISLYVRDNNIVGFSSVWHRPEYYELGEVRVLNRYYEMPSMRRISKIIAGQHLIEMITQQVNIAKELGFTKAFISREHTPRYFKKLILNIEEKTATTWVLEPDKVCVCVPEAPSCWQYKAWINL